MRHHIEALGALVLVGTLAWTGAAFASEASWGNQVVEWPARRDVLLNVPPSDPLYFSPAPFYNWNAGGFANGLYYNPYYCYAPGACVLGYHPY
jgi:hypothetical protein